MASLTVIDNTCLRGSTKYSAGIQAQKEFGKWYSDMYTKKSSLQRTTKKKGY